MKPICVTIYPSPLRQKRKGEVAVAIAPYEATSSEQLTLGRGQLVMVRKKSETGWWEGEIQVRKPAAGSEVTANTASWRLWLDSRYTEAAMLV